MTFYREPESEPVIKLKGAGAGKHHLKRGSQAFSEPEPRLGAGGKRYRLPNTVSN